MPPIVFWRAMKNVIKIRSDGTSINEACRRYNEIKAREWADECAREFSMREDGDGIQSTCIVDLMAIYKDSPCVAIEYDGTYITLGDDRENYWFHADEVMTDAGLLDWVLHLSSKIWWNTDVDGYRLRGIVHQVRKVHSVKRKAKGK